MSQESAPTIRWLPTVRIPLALLIGVLVFSPAARAAIEPAGSADDFVDRIGVCTHWGYPDTPYGFAYDKVKKMLVDAGIRHVRDGWHAHEADLYTSAGIKTTMIFGPRDSMSQIVGLLKDHHSLVDMVEGPNEVDIFPSSANYKGTGFPDGPRLFMQDLYASVKGDPATADLGIIAPSTARAGSNRSLAPLSCFDYLVMHSYAGGGMPSNSLTSDMNNPVLGAYSILGADANLKPFVVTESGYHTALGSSVVIGGAQPGVSEWAQGKYLPRHFADYYNAGILRTFTYEFVDEFPDYAKDERDATNAEACFGMIKRDLTPKPAYTAIKNLIAILSEKRWNPIKQEWDEIDAKATAACPNALDFTLSGEVQNVRHTLLQKSNGDFYLLLWQEVPSFDLKTRTNILLPDADVRLDVRTRLSSAAIYRPGESVEPAQSGRPLQTLTLRVPDEVMIVRLTSARQIVSAPTPAPTGLASDTTPTEASLTWNPGRDPGRKATAYFVSRMGAYLATVKEPAFRDTNLVPGLGYTYTIRSCAPDGRVSRPAEIVAKTKSAFPDLILTDITFSPPDPKPGDPATLSATIKNIGLASTPAGVVHGVAFFVDGTFVNWSDTFRGPLAPGESKAVTANNGPKGAATWTWTEGTHTIKAQVDDVNRIVESNKNNNTLEKVVGK